ncbi:ADP-ribose pyrophosphatase [Tamaricihabitans halophyticus]|uniref:ADP-ribose pyrophosphatase n=2 Tax=Tamaricihabitans halophyticus TaxID=1262583 RepID=A0A4V2SQJ1_9PSEU|nr:ADP-ribose pyrophosphatase [Tamaricihabitans halophyticus]
MPGGNTARREVVEHHAAVAIVAMDDDDNVAMIRQYRHPMGDRLWELPAGLVDVAGEDPLAAARRELVEEAGLAARRWDVLVDVASSPGFTDEVVRVYLARDLTEVGRPEGTEEEADLQVRRMPLAETVRMALAGELINATAVSAVLAAHAVSTGAAESRPADAPWSSMSRTFAARLR